MDEKEFEVAIDVFLNGADMVIEEVDRSNREGVYLGRIEQDCTSIVIDESGRNIIISITGASEFNSFVSSVVFQIDIMNNNPASGRPGNRGPRVPRSQGNPASIVTPGMSGNVRGTGYPLRFVEISSALHCLL